MGIRRVCLKLLCYIMIGINLVSCNLQKEEGKKVADCDFTVLKTSEIPEELADIIEERKEKTIKLSYADQGYLYLVVGYGTQSGGGYSIKVDQLYETEGEICVKTTLLGPTRKGEEEGKTFPVIVLKMEYKEKEVCYFT